MIRQGAINLANSQGGYPRRSKTIHRRRVGRRRVRRRVVRTQNPFGNFRFG